jgi:hypothetical protein
MGISFLGLTFGIYLKIFHYETPIYIKEKAKKAPGGHKDPPGAFIFDLSGKPIS